jgi:hypothetical protein
MALASLLVPLLALAPRGVPPPQARTSNLHSRRHALGIAAAAAATAAGLPALPALAAEPSVKVYFGAGCA